MRLPAITVKIIVIATIRIISGALKLAIRETPRAMVMPSKKDTRNSLPTSRNQSLASTSPIARERIISVADCEPALPPLPIRSGRKNISGTIYLITFSNPAMAAPEKIFMNTRMVNQRIRLRYMKKTLALSGFKIAV